MWKEAMEKKMNILIVFRLELSSAADPYFQGFCGIVLLHVVS